MKILVVFKPIFLHDQSLGGVKTSAKIHIVSRKSQLHTLILGIAKQTPAEV